MNHVVYLPGALCSPLSFNYLHGELEHSSSFPIGTQHHFFEYDLNGKPAEEIVNSTIAFIRKSIKNDPSPIILLVGYSFGGVLAVAATRQLPDLNINILTISTPMGGSNAAAYLRFLKPKSLMLKNCSSSDSFMLNFINDYLRKDFPARVFSVVTSCVESNLFTEENDTVVTLKSQMQFSDSQHIKIKHLKHNHFEVMLSPQTVTFCKSVLKKVLK